jgi:hypothetical protein
MFFDNCVISESLYFSFQLSQVAREVSSVLLQNTLLKLFFSNYLANKKSGIDRSTSGVHFMFLTCLTLSFSGSVIMTVEPQQK